MNRNLKNDLLEDLNDASASLNRSQGRLKTERGLSVLECFDDIEKAIRAVESVRLAVQEGSYDHKSNTAFIPEHIQKENLLQAEVVTLAQNVRAERKPKTGEPVRHMLRKAA